MFAHRNVSWTVEQSGCILSVTTVFALRFQNLPAWNSSLKIFRLEKEEKLAGPKGKLASPAQFLVASGRRLMRRLHHCWLPSPWLGDWQWIFACFCRLSTNYTYLTCWNFVCQHSVMAETTVNQRAFAFISCSISKIGLSRFVYVGAIFSAVNTCRGFHLTVIAWRRSWHCCI